MAEKQVPYPDNPSQGHPANQGYPNQGPGYPNQGPGYLNQGYPSTAATAPAMVNGPQYGVPQATGQQYRDQCKY